jgi:translation initiation factor IF-2
MQLAAEREIVIHRAECFKRALILEKKKRKKPKRLNLLGEDASGVPQFFGPEEVKKAREF